MKNSTNSHIQIILIAQFGNYVDKIQIWKLAFVSHNFHIYETWRFLNKRNILRMQQVVRNPLLKLR